MNTNPFKAGSLLFLTVVVSLVVSCTTPEATAFEEGLDLDPRVQQFLETQSWGGRSNANVPAVDGQTLRNIVLEKGYTRALEIGTSTGHSTVWIASALSKTGGKLITIEIDEGRHRQAVENIKAAGLSDLVDARLGNAHEIVPTLEGPFDFVFSDADKGWYKNYLNALLPKLDVGGYKAGIGNAEKEGVAAAVRSKRLVAHHHVLGKSASNGNVLAPVDAQPFIAVGAHRAFRSLGPRILFDVGQACCKDSCRDRNAGKGLRGHAPISMCCRQQAVHHCHQECQRLSAGRRDDCHTAGVPGDGFHGQIHVAPVSKPLTRGSQK